MDKIDIILCQLLLTNSRRTYHELANMLNLSVTAIHKRIQTLIELGIIRKFTAKISLSALKAIHIIIFGQSKATSLYNLKDKLSMHESIYWLAMGSGNFLYIGAYLKNMNELEPFVNYIKNTVEMLEPTIGITSLTPYPNVYSFHDTSLYDLDYKIIRSLKDNSRKKISEVAEEIGVSTKTVRRRLSRMIKLGLIELSIEWYPDASNDIITIFHIHLKPEINERKISAIFNKYSPNIFLYFGFRNIPNLFLAFAWTNTMKELKNIQERFEREETVQSVLSNILYTGYIFETWRDRLL